MNSALHFFSVSALAPQADEEEVNAFIAQHRVVGLDKQWVSAGVDSFWALCVTVAAGPGPAPAAARLAGSKGERHGKVDYREVLNEADFAVFARLRSLRQGLALQEGAPPYALFTNEQLACMARQRPASAEAMRSIEGIGPARIEKYAAVFLACLAGGAPAAA